MDDVQSGINSIFGSAERIANSLLSYKLSKSIDAERNQQFTFTDAAGSQWLVGPQGQLFQRGTPALTTASVLGSPMASLLLIGAAGLALFLVLKD